MPDGVGNSSRGQIPVAALADWLAVQAHADNAHHLQAPKLLPGGAVQQNWLLDIDFAGGQLPGHQRLVLRANYQTPLPASRSKVEEFAILRAVSAAGITVPETLWLCGDSTVIGRPFFIMRWLPGDTDAGSLVASAARDSFGPSLTDQLAHELARLHNLSPETITLDCLGSPPDSPALAQVAQYRDWLARLAVNSDVLSGVCDWLERHAPRVGQFSLIHRDFRSGNFLVDEGSLTAILDWEFAGWGDPHEDIGWFCAACWRAGREDLEAGGLAPRADFYRAYEAVGGHPVDTQAVAYWEVMAHLRWAIIARQQGVRATAGDAPQHELLEAAARVPNLECTLAAMIAP